MVAASLLESTLSLVSKQVATPKRSLVSKAFQKKIVVACEEEQLQEFELDIVDFESGVEASFRALIQSRVSLLNILTL